MQAEAGQACGVSPWYPTSLAFLKLSRQTVKSHLGRSAEPGPSKLIMVVSQRTAASGLGVKNFQEPKGFCS